MPAGGDLAFLRTAGVASAAFRHDFGRLRQINLRVHLGDRGGRMPEDRTRRVKPVLSPNLGRSRVPQLVWMPMRYTGLLACQRNSLMIRSGRVAVAWLLLRLSLAT